MATISAENVPDSRNEAAEESEHGHTPDSTVKSSGKRKKVDQTVTLTNPDVFDCLICCEPLSVPVFQCESGHVACFDCCGSNENVCPFCYKQIGNVRCRVIEDILESIVGPCPNSRYGCKKKLKYGERKDHANSCSYSLCPCPLPDCDFIASSKPLYTHFNRKHPMEAINFQYYTSFTIDLKMEEKFLVLREKKAGVLFLLGNRFHTLGKAVTVNRIGSAAPGESLSFELAMKTIETTLTLQSVMRSIKELVDFPPPQELLLIPNKFFASNNQIKLDLRIW